MKLRVILTLVGVITATPALALVWPGMLASSYGLSDLDPMTTALLQHRGVLQGALGAAIVWAAFHPPVRVPASATAIVTKTTFLALTAVDAKLRADLNLVSLVFDPIAILILAAVIVHQLRAARPAPASV
jgi:hypothetical protein